MWARVLNNEVSMVVSNLPKTFQGVSQFDELTEVQLLAYGWFPYTKTVPTFDKATQYVRSAGYTISATSVEEVFDVFTKLALTNPVRTLFTKLEFRSRFTDAELVAIEVAKDTGTTQVKAYLRVLSDNMAVANDIDIADPRTIAGVQLLVSLGLLTSPRATEILTP